MGGDEADAHIDLRRQLGHQLDADAARGVRPKAHHPGWCSYSSVQRQAECLLADVSRGRLSAQ